MKKYQLSLLLTSIAAGSSAQTYLDIDFEDSTTIANYVVVDTVADPNNSWHIGHPNKPVFNSAASGANVIATDLVHPYPANDTSSFIVIHIAWDGWALSYPKVDIGGNYYVDSDSLSDYGFIDFSADHGATWYRADSSEGFCTWGAVEELPTFTGSSGGWRPFYYCLQVPFPVPMGDTVLYRFTFISDSIQTNKDGLMFDDLHFEDWAEGIQEAGGQNLISVDPNPVTDELIIHSTKNANDEKIRIFEPTGRIVLEDPHFKGGAIDVRHLYAGLYLLQYEDEKGRRWESKIVKE